MLAPLVTLAACVLVKRHRLRELNFGLAPGVNYFKHVTIGITKKESLEWRGAIRNQAASTSMLPGRSIGSQPNVTAKKSRDAMTSRVANVRWAKLIDQDIG